MLTALLLPVLGGLAASAVDLSYLYAQRQASQGAADAAAQAGAIAQGKGYTTTTVNTDALKYASLNGFSSSNSTITVNVPPKSPPASATYTSGAVQVIISLHVDPFLAGIIGVTGLNSTVQAVAISAGALPTPGSMWILDHSASNALSANGNACITIAGTIYVNSSATPAISQSGPGCGSGYGISAAQGINEVGSNSSGCCSPVPTKMTAPVADPLATIKMPYYSSGKWYSGDSTQLSSRTVSGSTLNPGVYTGGINISGGTYTMNPGVYVMDGGGFAISGQANITGAGVFVYSSSSTSPSTCGAISLAGGGSSTITSPTSGIYQGMVFGQDRSCPTTFTISGGNSMTLEGCFYFPDATVSMSGTSAFSASADIVANKMNVAGTPMTVRPPDAAHTPQIANVSLVE